MRISIISLFFVLLGGKFASAQEVLVGIEHNNQVEEKSKTYGNRSTSSLIALPFYDDFAKACVYPNEDLWLDNQVFINYDYGVEPPTIGVATFDAIDETGTIHDNASQNQFLADILTSKAINLKDHYVPNTLLFPSDSLYTKVLDTVYVYASNGLFWLGDNVYYNCVDSVIQIGANDSLYLLDGTDTILNTNDLFYHNELNDEYIGLGDSILVDYSPADSIFFSFYYQPQGMGFSPESRDSLVLEFYSPLDSLWHWTWSKTGSAITDFKYELIPLVDSMYFGEGFQFRFKNYASLSDNTSPSINSNNDHWNIDVVYLNCNRSVFDTTMNDVAIIEPLRSTMKNYQSMPWPHFRYDDSEAKNIFSVPFKNYSQDTIHYDRFYDLVNRDAGLFSYGRPLGSFDIFPYWIETIGDIYISGLLNTDYGGDSALFEMKSYYTLQYEGIPEYKRQNDTSEYHQKFYNYYAYDDGTAEAGYGLLGAGTENSNVAQKYRIYKPDTLRGVQMYFNNTLTGANEKYFYLTIWKNDNGFPGDIIYQREGASAEFSGGMNKFNYYELILDSLTIVDSSYLVSSGTNEYIYISDTSVFVGWKKIFTTDMLNIGFDKNIVRPDRIFYTYSGSWYPSSMEGVLMIRPVFGQDFVASVHASAIPKNNLVLYPNPASDQINVSAGNEDIELLSVYDLYGKLCLTAKNETLLDVSVLPAGVYVVQVVTESRNVYTSRFIVQP
ncbi:MAG: hypothetical protein C0594_13825 [Marinilabiliales bacterium]|nr:MAG: hypothetical protein C0594_13825 [Marinilabiliales bacterium]